jgi:hypothetical protein
VLGGVAYAQQHYEKAARLFGAAEMLREILGFCTYPWDQAYHDQRVAYTHDALGDTAFAAAWGGGQAITLEQANEYALGNEAS